MSLAISMASSSEEKVTIGATGPKISCWRIGLPFSTLIAVGA